MISKNMNIKLGIRVKNLILSNVFKKKVSFFNIFYSFFL